MTSTRDYINPKVRVLKKKQKQPIQSTKKKKQKTKKTTPSRHDPAMYKEILGSVAPMGSQSNK